MSAHRIFSGPSKLLWPFVENSLKRGRAVLRLLNFEKNDLNHIVYNSISDYKSFCKWLYKDAKFLPIKKI